MAVSKVVYGGRTLVDLTADTVDAAHLAKGYTAHGASGEAVTGTHDDAWSTGVAEYDQQTAGVAAYLEATKDYTASNHGTVSHASMLAAGGDTCDERVCGARGRLGGRGPLHARGRQGHCV